MQYMYQPDEKESELNWCSSATQVTSTWWRYSYCGHNMHEIAISIPRVVYLLVLNTINLFSTLHNTLRSRISGLFTN